jgi:hypothetical protein
LVDLKAPGFDAPTSMVRNDVGERACEILLVHRVKVK